MDIVEHIVSTNHGKIMDEKILSDLGPLSLLAGTWEGVNGEDTAPSDDRGTEKNKYKEKMVFEPVGLTQNHEQALHGLRYHTKPGGSANPTRSTMRLDTGFGRQKPNRL